MINKYDKLFLEQTLDLAQQAFNLNEIPVGAVLVDSKNIIISEAYNTTKLDGSRLYHAEMKALYKAKHIYYNKLMDDCTLYCSLEPCIMCISASIICGIKKIIFILKSNELGGLSLFEGLNLEIKNKILIIQDKEYENKSKNMLNKFFEKNRKKNY